MQKTFEYGGYDVVVTAMAADGGFHADVRIGDTFGSDGSPSFEQEMDIVADADEALAKGEALAMAVIDAGEVN